MRGITLREEDAQEEDQINLQRSPELRMSAGEGGEGWRGVEESHTMHPYIYHYLHGSMEVPFQPLPSLEFAWCLQRAIVSTALFKMVCHS
jgi:hypothetical protein